LKKNIKSILSISAAGRGNASPVTYTIIQEKCKKCALCFTNCPVKAISGNRETGYKMTNHYVPNAANVKRSVSLKQFQRNDKYFAFRYTEYLYSPSSKRKPLFFVRAGKSAIEMVGRND